MPLFDLFIPNAVRTRLLERLSAYDAAKLDMIFGQFLDTRERNLYLNPLRDLVFDLAEARALEAYGMRLLLLGNDVFALHARLQRPQHYIRKHVQLHLSSENTAFGACSAQSPHLRSDKASVSSKRTDHELSKLLLWHEGVASTSPSGMTITPCCA